MGADRNTPLPSRSGAGARGLDSQATPHCSTRTTGFDGPPTTDVRARRLVPVGQRLRTSGETKMVMTGDRTYEVRVTGLVPNSVLLRLGDVEVTTQELRTVLSGRFPDQAALHGFLHRLRSLGLDVVEVRQVVSRASAAASNTVEADKVGGEDAPDTDTGA